MKAAVALAFLFGFLCFAPAIRALTADELLLVVNKNVPESQELAEFYAKARKVPANRIVQLNLPTSEQMTFDCYEQNVVPPLRQFLRQNDPANHIRCLVTFYGVPFRVAPRADNAQEVAELAILHAQLKTVLNHLTGLVTQAEAMAVARDPQFKPFMPPAAIVDPEGSAAIDNLARRTDFAGKAILSAIGKIADPDQQQTAKNEIVTLVERFREPVTGLVETTGGTTMPATDPAKATVQQREELEDRRFDPGCRRTYRQQAAAVAGPFNYAKILLAQIGYLSPDESEAATDSELSLLKLGYYPRNRWQISGLNYRLGGVAGTQLMMVSRLDGPDANLVHDTIVDSLRAELQGLKGKFVIDSRGLQKTGNAKDDAYAIYDISLRSLAAIIRQKTTIPLVFDERPEILPAHSAEDVALYCGWYSLANHVPECAFVPGAVGFHVASLEMTSLRDPANNGWVRGLLKDGVAATLGPVSEPYLQSFPLADEFFPLLLTGKLTLAEVFWKTELMNSWRQCLIGDPLYNPFLTNPAMKVSDLPPMLQRVFGISMTPTPAQAPPTSSSAAH